MVTAVLAFSIPAMAQSTYDEELSQMSGSLRALMVRAERVRPSDVEARGAIQDELIELSTRLHRLQEEAMLANNELRRRRLDNASDRQLLLSASIAKALDLAQLLTFYYLDTGDKIFWSSALAAAQTARTMQAAR